MFASRRSTSSSALGLSSTAGRMNQKANRISSAAIIQKVSIVYVTQTVSLRACQNQCASSQPALQRLHTPQNLFRALTLVSAQRRLYNHFSPAAEITIQNHRAA